MTTKTDFMCAHSHSIRLKYSFFAAWGSEVLSIILDLKAFVD